MSSSRSARETLTFRKANTQYKRFLEIRGRTRASWSCVIRGTGCNDLVRSLIERRHKEIERGRKQKEAGGKGGGGRRRRRRKRKSTMWLVAEDAWRRQYDSDSILRIEATWSQVKNSSNYYHWERARTLKPLHNSLHPHSKQDRCEVSGEHDEEAVLCVGITAVRRSVGRSVGRSVVWLTSTAVASSTLAKCSGIMGMELVLCNWTGEKAHRVTLIRFSKHP